MEQTTIRNTSNFGKQNPINGLLCKYTNVVKGKQNQIDRQQTMIKCDE